MLWTLSLAGVGVVLTLITLSPLLCSPPAALQQAVKVTAFLMLWVGVSEALIRT